MNVGLVLSTWGKNLGKKLSKPKIVDKGPKPEQRWNIVRGDIVQVVQGPERGQKGKVLTVLRDTERVIIEGVNVRPRIVKNNLAGQPGRRVAKPCSIHYSNVALVDPTTGEPTKVSRRYLEDGTKVRISKATGSVIPKPNPLADRKPRNFLVGPKDTAAKDALEVTFADYEKYLPFIYGSKKTA